VYCETSDHARDEVFAVLSLAVKGYDIEPDYSTSRSMAALCIHITRSIVDFEKNTDFL
jgi:hypothetical protein